MGGGRWVLPGVGSALVATLLATATSFSLQSPEREWGPEAEVAARQWLAPIEWSWRNASEAWPRAALTLSALLEAAASAASAASA